MPVATPGTSTGARRVDVMGSYYTDRPRRVLRSGRWLTHDNAKRSDPASSDPAVVAAHRVGHACRSPRVPRPPRHCATGRTRPRVVAESAALARVGSRAPRDASRRDRSRSPRCATIAPAFFVLAVVAAFTWRTIDGRDGRRRWSRRRSLRVLASGHDIAIAAANAIAYGDELRVPLRVPPALFLAPLPLARALVVVGVAARTAAARRRPHRARRRRARGRRPPWPSCWHARSTRLSRRWAVLVPAGFVVVDPMTLADPVLFLREASCGMQARRRRDRAPDGVLDLRLGATMGSVSLSFDQVAELFRAGRGRRADRDGDDRRDLLIAVVRRDEMLHLRRARGDSVRARSVARYAAMPPPSSASPS